MKIVKNISMKSAYHSLHKLFLPRRNLLFNGNQSCGKFNFVMLIVDDVESTIVVNLGLLNVFVILVIDHVVAERPWPLILMR